MAGLDLGRRLNESLFNENLPCVQHALESVTITTQQPRLLAEIFAFPLQQLRSVDERICRESAQALSSRIGLVDERVLSAHIPDIILTVMP